MLLSPDLLSVFNGIAGHFFPQASARLCFTVLNSVAGSQNDVSAFATTLPNRSPAAS